MLAAREPDRCASRMRGAGFTLVEVLVALSLVAFAMLGVARVQLGALQSGRLALDALGTEGHVRGLAERMRALHGAPADVRALLGGPGANLGCRGATRCTPMEFAQYEAWSWYEEAAALRDAEPAPIAVSAEGAPAQFVLRLRHRVGAAYALEVAS